MTALLNQIVFLEAVDAHHLCMNADRYRLAALAVRQIVAGEFGNLGMHTFVSPILASLQTTAENIFFDGHQRFADLDGRLDASRAHEIAESLVQRLRRPGRA